MKRIADSGENDIRRFLLAECLEAYAQLDESEANRVRALLEAEGYRKVEPLMKTTYERGIEAGIKQGIEQGIERGVERGERLSALRIMEARFGPLSSDVRRQVEELSRDELERLQIAILTARSLADLGLDG